MEPIIILNRIRTPDTTVLTSYHVHDYKEHLDKNGFTYVVDGGNEYLRRIGNNYEELSVYSNASFDIIRESLHRYDRITERYVAVKDMSDNWIVNLIIYFELYPTEVIDFLIEVYKKEQLYRMMINRDKIIDSL